MCKAEMTQTLKTLTVNFSFAYMIHQQILISQSVPKNNFYFQCTETNEVEIFSKYICM